MFKDLWTIMCLIEFLFEKCIIIIIMKKYGNIIHYVQYIIQLMVNW